MPEREQLTQKDIQGPEKETSEPGLEIARTPESETVVDLANELHEAIQNDSPITYGKVEDFREALDQLKFNIGGEMMTAEEARKIPDLKLNMEIWKRIKVGDYSTSTITQMTYVSLEVADILKNVGTVRLLNVKYFPSSILRKLCERKGYLTLGIEEISDQDAEIISNHQGELFLDNITRLSVKQAEFLSQHRGQLSLAGLESLPDQAAIYFIDFKHFLNVQSRITTQIGRLRKRSRKK
ncbi:MAG: hypothetical protein WC663_02105 [Patescibacteria group bacterium]|jgi:hypothetical protein